MGWRMKLKEKLAEEYQEKRFNGPGSFTDQEDPYLAGFEKAREMAAAEFEASRERYMHWHFNSAWDSVLRDLRQVGEGEVEK